MPRKRFYKRFPPRRRREGKTDYRLRVRLVKSGLPRLVVRKSNRYITVQVTEPRRGGDRTLLTVSSKTLGKYGWRGPTGSIPAAYLTGLLAGKLARERGVQASIPDIGMTRAVHGSRVFAAIKGALDAGLEISLGEGAAPPEERLRGEHILRLYEQVASREGRTQFTAISPEVLQRLPEHFDEVKSAILG